MPLLPLPKHENDADVRFVNSPKKKEKEKEKRKKCVKIIRIKAKIKDCRTDS